MLPDEKRPSFFPLSIDLRTFLINVIQSSFLSEEEEMFLPPPHPLLRKALFSTFELPPRMVRGFSPFLLLRE